MRQFELYYRKPQSEPFQPRHMSHQPSGSLSEDTVQRIVRMYTSGQGIEAITRQVSRARHFVVHILQTRGVFGIRRSNPDPKETLTPAIAKGSKEGLANEVVKPELVERPAEQANSIGKSESPKKRKAAEAQTKVSKVKNTPVTTRWSPPVLAALCKVAGQPDLAADMSLEDVQKLALLPKRRATG